MTILWSIVYQYVTGLKNTNCGGGGVVKGKGKIVPVLWLSTTPRRRIGGVEV
jgi:hypothetical protein